VREGKESGREEKEEMGKGREKGMRGKEGKGECCVTAFGGMDAPAHRGLYNNFGKTTNAWWAGGFV